MRFLQGGHGFYPRSRDDYPPLNLCNLPVISYMMLHLPGSARASAGLAMLQASIAEFVDPDRKQGPPNGFSAFRCPEVPGRDSRVPASVK